jgi:hypothetical protein
MEEQAVIYGVQDNQEFKYIGKTIKSVRENRDIRKSDIARRYTNEKINNVFTENPDVNVVVLKTIAIQEWYDEKLKEVVDKHKDNHPLLNAQWMLDGKRGYWDGTDGYWKGKQRDPHTLQRLSESKYKRVVQYDKQGKLVKIWNGGKEVAIQVFKDYRVKNGSACSKIYGVLKSNVLKGKYRFDSYWFREEDLIQNFNSIPNKLDLDELRKKEAQHKKANYKRPETYRRYTVIQYNLNGREIQRYSNIFEAGHALKLSPSIVGKICRGVIVPKDFILKYGQKELQPMNINKPKYKTKPIQWMKKVDNQKFEVDFDDIYDVDL